MKYVSFNAGLFIHSTRQHKATQQFQEQHKLAEIHPSRRGECFKAPC